MNPLNPNTLSPLSTDLLSREAPNPAAGAAFRRASKAAADARPWLARLRFAPAVVRFACTVLLRKQAAERFVLRWSERVLYVAIAVVCLAGGAYVACSGHAPAERYAIGPDPDAARPLMPKPAPTAYASLAQDAGSRDAGPLVAMASR
jgi:hypothetical protein